MSATARRVLFVLGVAGLLTVLAWGALGAPAYGEYLGPYGDVLDAIATPERHATDVVTAINFDYRALDTLGEELILFGSVLGAMLLLRTGEKTKERDARRLDRADASKTREAPPPSNAVRLLCLALVGVTVVFGVYVVTHGQLSPGGGFQGGVILATVPLFVYLSGDLGLFHKIAPRALVDIAEATAMGAFVVVGLLGVALHQAYLANVLPLGTTGNVYSAGTIAVISIITGVEVAGGFVVLLSSFLSEMLERPPDAPRGGGGAPEGSPASTKARR